LTKDSITRIGYWGSEETSVVWEGQFQHGELQSYYWWGMWGFSSPRRDKSRRL